MCAQSMSDRVLSSTESDRASRSRRYATDCDLVQQLLSIYNNMKIPNTMCLSEGEKVSSLLQAR